MQKTSAPEKATKVHKLFLVELVMLNALNFQELLSGIRCLISKIKGPQLHNCQFMAY